MSNTNALQDWYDGIKAKGQSKALAGCTQAVLSNAEPKHTINKVNKQFPIISRSLAERNAKKVAKPAEKPDTLDSLFNIF